MDENDVTIFAAIDSLLLNDKHLETMRAALRKTAGLDLAMEVVRCCLNLDTPRGDSFSWDLLLPLHDLPDLTRNIVLTIAVEDFWCLQKIQKRADQQNKDTAAWMERAFWFLASGILSDMDQKFPPKQIAPIVSYVLNSDELLTEFLGCQLQQTEERDRTRGFRGIISNIAFSIKGLCGTKSVVAPLTVFFQCYCWKEETGETARISGQFLSEKMQWHDLVSEYVACQSLVALVDLASTVMLAVDDQRQGTDNRQILSASELELVQFMLSTISILHDTYDYDISNTSLYLAKDFGSCFRQLFSSSDSFPQFLDCILAQSSVLAPGKLVPELLELASTEGALSRVSHF